MTTQDDFGLRRCGRSATRLLALAGLTFSISVQAQSPTVTMTNDVRFQPGSIEVPVGTTVTWRNTSAMPHTVTADPSKASDPSHVHLPRGAQPFDSALIPPGGSFSHTFSVPGEYTYFCIPHEDAGMMGTVTVKQ